MALKHLLLFFLFTLVALTRLPTVSACDGISNSTSNSIFPNIGPGDVVYRYADLMSGPEPDDQFPGIEADTTSTAHPSLAVHAAGWDPSAPTEAKIAMVRLSAVKQHVAEFAGQRLFDIIHDALLKMCPYERGRIGCYPDMPGAGKPNDDNTLQSKYKYYDRVYILDVPYKTSKGEYATNAWITITAQAIYREDKYPGIVAATYEMAAGVFKQATEVHRDGILLNCYLEDFNKKSRPYTFCNVPKHVLVALPANNGDVTESWLSVTIEFNGNTEYGDFQCYDSMAGVSAFWVTAVLPDVTKSMAIVASDTSRLCVECWNEDDRFDVKTWRDHHTCDDIGWGPSK